MAKQLRAWPGDTSGAMITRTAAKDFTHKGVPYKKGDPITVHENYIPGLEKINALEPLPELPDIDPDDPATGE